MSIETTDTTPVDTGSGSDLDAFESDFFGQKEDSLEPASSEEAEAPVEKEDAPLEDTQNPEDESLEPEEEPVPITPTGKKKNSFQDRLNEVIGQREEVKREFEAFKAAIEASKSATPEPTAPIVEAGGVPNPDAKLADGTDKYPMGQFDANYIADLMKYTYSQEKAADDAAKAEKAQRDAAAQAQTELQSGWNTQIVTAKERYPDFLEQALSLDPIFEGIDESYGTYLTNTLMSMDNGADVLYYLANNIDLAKDIVASGATKATIALGRLEAQFVGGGESVDATPRLKVSKAPAPPPTAKGTAPVKRITADTEDLDEFETLMFKKK